MTNIDNEPKEDSKKNLKLNFKSAFRRYDFVVTLEHTLLGWKTDFSGRNIKTGRDGDMIIKTLSSAEGVDVSPNAKEAFANAWFGLSDGEDPEEVNSKLERELKRK
jgi:hypothetical protein